MLIKIELPMIINLPSQDRHTVYLGIQVIRRHIHVMVNNIALYAGGQGRQNRWHVCVGVCTAVCVCARVCACVCV